MNGNTQNIASHLEYFTSVASGIENGTNKTEQAVTNTSFALPLFWHEVTSVSKKISHHCTKLCLALTKPPMPSDSDLSGMLSPVKQCVGELSNLAGLLPPCCGRELKSEVTAASLSLVRSIIGLLSLVEKQDIQQLESAYHRMTGMAWDECRALESLPRTNTHAVQQALTAQASTVEDALAEITEALEGDGSGWNCFQMPCQEGGSDDSDGGEEEATWSERDKERLKPAVNIVKGIKLLYKRSLEALAASTSSLAVEEITPENCSLWHRLDEVREQLQSLPERVDDLVLAMYPPVNYDNLRKNSEETVSQTLSALSSLQQSRAGSEATAQHLSFLVTALTHNRDQLNRDHAAGK